MKQCVFISLVLTTAFTLTATAQEKAKAKNAGKAKAKTAKSTDASLPEGVKELTYKQTPQGELKLLVHYPPGWKATDQRPAIVFFFGGGWKNGTTAQFLNQATYLATRGMVAVRADYRVASRQQTTPESAVEDAKSAVRWVRAHASELGVDPQRIVASGGSAGGHLAACTGMTDAYEARSEDAKVSSRPNAMVLFNPALDLAALEVAEKWPEGKGDGKAIVPQIDPARFIKKDIVPTVVFFGTADKMLDHARAFADKSKSAGNRCEVFSAAEQPHGFFNRSPWQEITLRQTDAFLASLGYLKGEPMVKIPGEGKPELKREK
ncbi:MAG: alpha/beta hydrolase [Limisphaerales bacterium]|nr:MAG: alpha/beta hydrolase [Limisphaerales bacterium]KAG0510770.1 MAG: alpha/beta hydrolase [Limisphaerales bacterium]TXT52666.1 MAG: alpha/beta hydrolase [Limisphaerales bacterium]